MSVLITVYGLKQGTFMVEIPKVGVRNLDLSFSFVMQKFKINSMK